MKNTIQALAVASALVLAPVAMAEVKIGTVNMKSIFGGYYKTKDADAKMNDERAKFKRELDEKTDKIKALEADITKDREELKKTEIADAKKAVIAKAQEKKLADWQEAMKDRQGFLEERGKQIEVQIVRIRNGIVEDILKVVNDKVKLEGFDLVFDTSGFSVNNVPVVLHAKDSYDFTKSIVEKLNSDRPASSTVDDKAPSALNLGEPPAAAKEGLAPAATSKKK
jgi:outer membrane protein